MKDTYLIERKDNIFSKIKNWFQGIFFKNKIQKETKNVTENTYNIDNTNNNIEKTDSKLKMYEEDKNSFMEIYKKVKNKEIDIDMLDEETTEKICQLLEEEVKLKGKIINDKYKRIKNFENNTENTDL